MHRADFEFGSVSDRIVAGAGEDVDRHVVEAEAGKDRAARRAGGALDADFNGSACAGQAAQAPVCEAPSGEVFGVDFEALFGEEVVDPLRAAGLGAGVVGLEPAAGRQPDWELGRNGLGWVAVADDFEQAAAVSEGPLVQHWRSPDGPFRARASGTRPCRSGPNRGRRRWERGRHSSLNTSLAEV